MSMDPVQQQIASAITAAMRKPRTEATAYSEADMAAVAAQAARLRGQANRLEAAAGFRPVVALDKAAKGELIYPEVPDDAGE